jgi:hypothetical protein
LLRKLLTNIKDAQGPAATTAAFLGFYMMPVAILRRLVSDEVGANSPARRRQSLADRLRLPHTVVKISRLWHAARAAAANCRRRRGTSTPVTSPKSQRKRRDPDVNYSTLPSKTISARSTHDRPQLPTVHLRKSDSRNRVQNPINAFWSKTFPNIFGRFPSRETIPRLKWRDTQL